MKRIFAVLPVLLLVGFLVPHVTAYNAPREEQPLPAILVRIAQCESDSKQFNADGTVVRGKINHLDVGKYQINLKYHEQRAKELGLDLFTEEGNTEYALILYSEQGTKPWRYSQDCWTTL